MYLFLHFNYYLGRPSKLLVDELRSHIQVLRLLFALVQMALRHDRRVCFLLDLFHTKPVSFKIKVKDFIFCDATPSHIGITDNSISVTKGFESPIYHNEFVGGFVGKILFPNRFLFTDNLGALYNLRWLKLPHSFFHLPFKELKKVLNLSTLSPVFYIKSASNPADAISRRVL